MIEAFIIDQIKKSEEQGKWEPSPVMVPTEVEYQDKKEESKEKVNVVRL